MTSQAQIYPNLVEDKYNSSSSDEDSGTLLFLGINKLIK
jgi:hypothetical protein